MKNVMHFIFVVAAFFNAIRADMATFYLPREEVRFAEFITLKDDTLYIEVPRPVGFSEKRCIHKELVSKVILHDGKIVNLKWKNSPAELNSPKIPQTGIPHSDYVIIKNAKDFRLYREHIAVSTLTTSGMTRNEASSLTDILRAELGKTGRYQVMERSQMAEILKEQGFQESGACVDDCVVKMGQILRVRTMVVGNIGKVGTTYTINARMVGVASGKIMQEAVCMHKGKKEKLLTDVVPRVAAILSGTRPEKNKVRRLWITTAGTLAAAAIAVPVAIVYIRNNVDGEEVTGDKGSAEIVW